jgi:uncharacterized membrane protein
MRGAHCNCDLFYFDSCTTEPRTKDQATLKGILILLTIGTIFSTWLLLHTLFAIHYAHDYYLAKAVMQMVV